ncbi:CLUMA_CG017954, isoform A [Clunio marinus]|uniref:CLUMA_CG017954, isoform A n=1 Tax=Clunio marinus TaxID=568069 RepID=A0A1J1IXM6_9DIPT|nr:CLUMA_CG017954, isoform A [Clunio marinus]
MFLFFNFGFRDLWDRCTSLIMQMSCDVIIIFMILIPKIKINPSIVLAHGRALTKANAKYPINLVLLKSVSLGSNLQPKMIDNIFIGQLPKRVYLAFVNSSAMNGSLKLNPYNFHHYNFTNILLTTDSHTQIRPIQCDFSKGHYLEAYLSLFESSNIFFKDDGIAIERANYSGGYSIVGYDLTTDIGASEFHWSVPRNGSLRLDIKFAELAAYGED